MKWEYVTKVSNYADIINSEQNIFLEHYRMQLLFLTSYHLLVAK